MRLIEVLLGAASVGSASGYTINNAIWLDGVADTLTRTATSSATHSGSVLIKRAKLGATQNIFGTTIYFNSSDQLVINGLTTTAKFRDPTAWLHLHWNSTGPYINGTLMTGTGTYATAALTNPQVGGPTNFLSAYLADFRFGDGQDWAVGATGEIDADTGIWVPINASLTYGTEGVFLDFAIAPGTGNGAGEDVSGNGNHFTEVSMTAVQQVTDVPTNDADNGLGDYCTLNLLSGMEGGTGTLSEANTKIAVTAQDRYMGTMHFPKSGQYYFEFELVTGSLCANGICKYPEYRNANIAGSNLQNSLTYAPGGTATGDGGLPDTSDSIGSYTVGDSIGVAVDVDADTVQYYKNGVAAGSAIAFTGIAGMTPFIYAWGTTTIKTRFGAEGFTDTPPTGYVPLSTANLPAATILDPSEHHFIDADVSHNGTTGSFTLPGDPTVDDWLIIVKSRTAAEKWWWFDALRGYTIYSSSNSTAAEVTDATTLSVASSGVVTMGAAFSSGTYVVEAHKAGSTSGSGTSNTDGSRTTTVSTNTTSGFTIGLFTTGASATTQTYGTGLSTAVDYLIFRDRTTVSGWWVYHQVIGETQFLRLDGNNASSTNSNFMNNTAPGATVFTSTENNWLNASKTHVFYGWHGVEGYSKFRTYTGNGSADGPVINLGFTPSQWMLKRTDAAANWWQHDDKRSTYNIRDDRIGVNTTQADTSGIGVDFLSNGVKVRNTSTEWNASGGTIIYMSWAEAPEGTGTTAQVRAK